MKNITRNSPGGEYRRYRIWRGWDYFEDRLRATQSRRVWWTGCGWSQQRCMGKIYRSDAEVRLARERMERDGLAVNAERVQ